MRLLVVFVAACAGREAPPLAHRTAPPDVARLVADADAAFAASTRPDYRQPFAESSVDRAPVRARYLAACRAGDRRSCWIARDVTGDRDDVAEALVRANCRAGDVASCRAIHLGNGELDDFLGRVGRSCGLTCDPRTIRRECAAGFPTSCLAAALPKAHDGDVLRARALELARDGCERGILSECLLVLRGDHDTARWTRAAERACELSSQYCFDLGHRALLLHEPARARNAYERLCQTSRRDLRRRNCQPLVAGYHANELPEPVPGRRAAVLAWAEGEGIDTATAPGLIDY